MSTTSGDDAPSTPAAGPPAAAPGGAAARGATAADRPAPDADGPVPADTAPDGAPRPAAPPEPAIESSVRADAVGDAAPGDERPATGGAHDEDASPPVPGAAPVGGEAATAPSTKPEPAPSTEPSPEPSGEPASRPGDDATPRSGPAPAAVRMDEGTLEPEAAPEAQDRAAAPDAEPELTQVVDLTGAETAGPAAPVPASPPVPAAQAVPVEPAAPSGSDPTVVVVTDRTLRDPGDEPDPGRPIVPTQERAAAPPVATPVHPPVAAQRTPPETPATPVNPPVAAARTPPETPHVAAVAAPVDVLPHEPVGPPHEPVGPPPPAPTTGGLLLQDVPGGWDGARRRKRRQTLTFLAGLLLVLVLGGLAGLMYLGRVDWPFGGRVDVAAQACTHSRPVPPKQIRVRVYNGSGRKGLAAQVAARLKALGFVVLDKGNDPLEAKVRAAVEVRYGEDGERAGRTATAYFAGKAALARDERLDNTVDLVLGPSFSRLHTRRETARSLAAVSSTLPLSCPPGVTPTPSVRPSGTPGPSASPKA